VPVVSSLSCLPPIRRASHTVLNPRDNEPFAVSPEDAGPGAPEGLAPGAQALDHAEGLGAEASAPADGLATPADGTAPKAGLKKRAIPDPPEIDQSKGRQTLWFLLVLALAAALMMAAVGTLNVLADPYGLVGTKLLPTVTTSDRTIKADFIEKLKQPPQLVVLGSSRSMRYEPAYLQQKTGLRTFNAGVNGIGGTADAWAMTNFIHDTFPDSHPAYLWMVDVESFVPFEIQGRTASEPRLAQYVDGSGTTQRTTGAIVKSIWDNRSSVFSWVTAKDAVRVLLNRKKVKASLQAYRSKFLPSGVLAQRLWTKKEWDRRFPKSVKRYGDLYRNAYKKLDPEAQRYFEKTLKYMNDHGSTPLLALTPINPKLLAVVGPLGWYTRHQQVVDYIDSLHGKYKFVFVDITDITKFGADPKQFYDGVHMTTINTRRAIDYVLQQAGGLPK